MTAEEEEDAREEAEQRQIMEAVGLLSQARNLTRQNRARGVGGPEGICEEVEALYQRVIEVGGLSFGGSIPAACLQESGASEAQLTKVPTRLRSHR